jgi:hypothetical protein
MRFRTTGFLVTAAILVASTLMPSWAWARYGATGPETNSFTADTMAPVTTFGCSAIGLAVHLTWADADNSTLNSHGSSLVDTYVIEHNINGAGFVPAATVSRPTLTINDNSFGNGILTLAPVTYRIHATKSTNWVTSTVTGAFTAHVTSAAGILSVVTCS